MGWQYLAFNVYAEGNVTSFGGYYFTDREDHKSYNQTKSYRSVYAWEDDPLNFLSIGGRMATLTSVENPFVGIIRHV